MAVPFTGIPASGQSKPPAPAEGKDKNRPEHSIQTSSSNAGRRTLLHPASPAARAESLQSSACFDAWAKPDPDLFDPYLKH